MQGSSGFSIKAMSDQYRQPLTSSKTLVLSRAKSLFPSRYLHELSCRLLIAAESRHWREIAHRSTKSLKQVRCILI